MRLRTLASGISTVLACSLAATACASSSKTGASAPNGTTTAATGPASPGAHLTAAACRLPHKAGQFSQAFTFKGKRRTYQLYVPGAYTGSARVPLVFNFHGYGSNAVQQMVYGNFKPLADEHDFLVVAPDGQDVGGRHFSFGNEPGLQNDVEMVRALLKHIEATLCVDAARVYSTGMSDGGAMTSILACVAPDKFAAFAPVALIIYCATAKSRPVAIVTFQGTADPIVPFNGGPVTCCGHAVLGSKPAAMASWAAHDRCAKQFTDTRLGTEVRRRTWKGCKGTSAAVFYIIDGGGHTWPGAVPIPSLGLTTQQVKASDVIWKFFAAHKLST